MNVGVFPGQGVDRDSVLDALPEGHACVEQADAILGRRLIRDVQSARGVFPTRVAQPAIFVAGVIAFRDAIADGATFDALVGHSLGEYTALAAGGAMSFGAGLRLVAARAAAMSVAARRVNGGMAAVVRLPADQAYEIAGRSGAAVANDNTHEQVVLSGDDEALVTAARLVNEAGGRTVRLAVEGPFHSDAMAGARGPLEEALVHTPFSMPKIPVISNVSALPYRAPGEIRKLLLEQLTGRVRFRDSIAWLAQQGATSFTDLGPGDVVGRLAEANRRHHEREIQHA